MSTANANYTTPTVPAPEGRSSVFDHPVGFWFFFWGEFAERCCYYGMRGILLLYMITRAALTEAATSLVAKTDAAKGQLPLFVRAGARYFSLADLFGLLVTAMGEATAPGAWPASARLLPLFGPMEVGQPAPASGVRIPVATLIDQCKVLGDTMAAGEWTLVPRNIVPAQVTIGTVTVTAAQFLRAMAEAYIGQTGSADVEVRWTGGNSALGDALPATRPVSDRGGTWTARPAAIRFEN